VERDLDAVRGGRIGTLLGPEATSDGVSDNESAPVTGPGPLCVGRGCC